MATTKQDQSLSVEQRLSNLYQLQTILSEIDRIRTIRGELPLEVKDLEDNIEGLRTRIDNYKKEIEELRRATAAENASIAEAKSKIDKYQAQIIGWLREFPDLTAAQVCDWLREHYREEVSERTVSRYVKQLREEYGLKKSAAPREYEAVPELPMGQQMQVDFGQKMMPNVDGGQTKVYVAAFVLSRSRYKYAQEQSRPFTSVDLVRICHDCFQYMGGMPEELVFDQDSIVCVSENAGDIIYTYEFKKFRQECGLSIRMCRGADPESKGKIENVVKYIKGNFLSHRLYVDDGILNGSCLD